MKRLIPLLLLSSLSWAAAPTYIQATRTLRNLDQLPLDDCRASYNLYSHRMTCSFSVPTGQTSPLAQISPAHYPMLTWSLPAHEAGLGFELTLIHADLSTPYAEAKFNFSVHYYRHPSDGYAVRLGSQYYSADIMLGTLRALLKKASQRQWLRSQLIYVQTGLSSPYSQDYVQGGQVRVGRRTVRFYGERCLTHFERQEYDGWNDAWSGCTYRDGRERAFPYVKPELLSPRLRAWMEERVLTLPLEGRLVAEVVANPGTTNLSFAEKDERTGYPYSVALTKEQATPFLRELDLTAPPMSVLYLFAGDAELGAGEEVLGCLMAKPNGDGELLDVDPACHRSRE